MTSTETGAGRPHVVIVGGGFGGLRAAVSLADADVDVTIIDKRNHHVFQPLLYQVATAGLAVSDIAMPLRAVLRRSKNVRVLLGEVEDIDTDTCRVQLYDGSHVEFDYLVVAAGARTRYPRGEEAQYVFGLKTLEDARAIRQRVLTCMEMAESEPDAAQRRALSTFVVVGGGPTGVEMAGALRELAMTNAGMGRGHLSEGDVRVVLVERGDRVLSSFDPPLSESAQRQLEALGVEVETATDLAFEGPGRVAVGGESLRVGAIVWAAGVEPVSLAEKVGPLASDGRVEVAEDCSLPHAPRVFAIGDIAHCTPEGHSEPLPGLAPVAMQQGEHVARQIRRTIAGKDREAFSYNDRGTMATIGRSRAVAQRGKMRLTGTLAWFAWLVVHLVTLVGFRNRMAVFLNWAWHYFTFRQGHRILLPSATQLDRPALDPAPDSAPEPEARRAS
ncbi:MAG: NAD(P)/FAD-dependent oxidoreductase [Nannocystaceae bacterium]|nr:NAD(P)/FAD-dependent oxidoreductase [bacterium]